MFTVLHERTANPTLNPIGQKRPMGTPPCHAMKLRVEDGAPRFVDGLHAWRWAVVEELLVALAEAFAVVVEGRAWDGRVAVARVGFERWRSAGRDVAACGFNAILDALVVNLDGGWGWAVDDRLRMRAAGSD